jgi:hypothetical protein
MLSTVPEMTLPWAWRLRRAADYDDERFLIAFVNAPTSSSTVNWTGDRVARTEDEARAYAWQCGISPGSFTNAVEQLRVLCAAGHADYVLSISGVRRADYVVSVSGSRTLLCHEP